MAQRANQAMSRGRVGGQTRGSIAFFTTYRPPAPLDIFSCPVPPSSSQDELHLTDGISYNYNCRPIPPQALKAIIARPKVGGATAADVDAGRVTGLVFVSERDGGLETLHVALRFSAGNRVKVLSMADIYSGAEFSGTRMEDSGCIGGGYERFDHSLIYVSTKQPVQKRRSPWTVVYKTNLRTGQTERLTPLNQFDLSPAVSPSGKMVAVASFQGNRWTGETENLKTNIMVMNVETQPPGGLGRRVLIKNGGWPTWGSDRVIFFHRATDTVVKAPNGDDKVVTTWGVFRYDIATNQPPVRVTPESISCMTPAAISETKVAVATIRQRSEFRSVRVEAQYRHIEIFDMAAPGQPVRITQRTRPRADHYNPFVLDGGARVGYHRCRCSQNGSDAVPRNFQEVQSPVKDVGLFRVSGVFPTISKDGSKLAFVDNQFKTLWLADKQGLRIVFQTQSPDSIFSPVWNQNPQKDIIYVCMGPSFQPKEKLHICAIPTLARTDVRHCFPLTKGDTNNAFPSTNPEGTRFVFRSTREGGHKNLWIMDKAHIGEYDGWEPRRLTNGAWTDTHCQWSPRGDWIVFSSTRDKPTVVPNPGISVDPGYFDVYLVKADDPAVRVRVMRSGIDFAGFVNHPVFSPDGRSIAVSSDLAAVSVEPISLPLFEHSVRPYGDVFIVDIDPDNISQNKDVKTFRRITHSRYENSTPFWTFFSTDDPNAQWTSLIRRGAAGEMSMPVCPYASPANGGESWQMTGHLCIPKRCC